MRPVIYLAVAITLGDRKLNYAVAWATQRQLMARGFSILNPALTMHPAGAFDIPHEVWMANALPQVAKCDPVLRIPGESVGADAEVRFAEQRGIPVFFSIEELEDWRSEKWNPEPDAPEPICGA